MEGAGGLLLVLCSPGRSYSDQLRPIDKLCILS